MKSLPLVCLSGAMAASAFAQTPTLSWDASQDLNGDSFWPSAENASAQWTFPLAATPVFGATDFPGAPVWFNSPAGTMASFDSFNNATTGNVSLELIFRPGDLLGNHVIFETGGNGDGTAFVIQANVVEFRVQDANDPSQRVILTHALIAGDEANFHHLAATVQVGAAGGNEVKFYVNGALSATGSATGNLNDWAGGDAAGLGRLNGGLPTGQTGFDAFTGDIALLRYYANTLMTDVQVQAKFDELQTGTLDSEPDGLPDFWENQFFMSLEFDSNDDNDTDSLTNAQELAAGTDPTLDDTDGDGLNDDVEINGDPATMPTIADTDGDGRLDGEEVNGDPTSDPTDPDTDDDGFVDGIEVDNGFDPNDPNDPPPGSGAKIIWVTENTDAANDPSPDDIGWTNLLQINGFDVERRDIRTLETDALALADLNAADLVIISRDTNSGNYNNGAGEVEAWNGITAPLIQMSSFLLRNTRWFWFNNNGNPATTGANIRVSDPSHPIFDGITLDGNNDFPIREAEMINVTAQTDAGNGTVLATDPGNGNVWIAFWETGTEFYAGAGQTTGGPRLWFGGGMVLNNPKGAENFTPDGERAFLNAINFLVSEPEPPVITDYTFDQTTGDMAVTWTAQSGTEYTVYYTDDLADLQKSGDAGDSITDNSLEDSDPADGSITFEFPHPDPGASELFFSVHVNE